MFSREFAFFPFINFAHRRVRGFRMTFERNSFLAFFTITWSEVGKNNVQAKKFYSSGILYLLPHSYFIFLSNLWVFGRLLCQGVCSLILHFTITFQFNLTEREDSEHENILPITRSCYYKIFHLRNRKRATKKCNSSCNIASKRFNSDIQQIRYQTERRW